MRPDDLGMEHHVVGSDGNDKGLGNKHENCDFNNGVSNDNGGTLCRRLAGISFVVMSALGFSITSVLVKSVMEVGFHALHLVLFRGIGQCISNLIAFIWSSEHPLGALTFDKRTKTWLLLRGLFGTTSLLSFYFAVDHAPFADASVAFFTAPAWSLILGFLILGEPVLGTHVVALGLVMAGVVCLVKPGSLFGQSNEYGLEQQSPDDQINASSAFASLEAPNAKWNQSVGVGVALGAAVFNSLAMIATRKLKGVSLLHIVLMYSLVSIVVSGLATLWLPWPDKVPLWAVGVSALVGPLGFASQAALNKGLQLETASTVTIVRTIDIVFAFAWQVLIFSQPVAFSSVLGGCLVVIASVVVTLTKLRGTGADFAKSETEMHQYTPVKVSK